MRSFPAKCRVARGLAAASQFASLTQPDAFGAGAFRRASLHSALRHNRHPPTMPLGEDHKPIVALGTWATKPKGQALSHPA